MGLHPLFNWQPIFISFCLFLSMSCTWADEPTTLKAANYTNQQLLSELLLVSAAEQTLDKAPALVVTFSQDLDPNFDPADFFTITQAGKVVEGVWAVIDSPRRLYFTQIQANTSYRIQIRPGVSAKNGLKLLKPLDFEIKTREIQPAFDFASKGSLIPQQLAAGLPIRVVNVPELDVEFLRVAPENLGGVLKAIRLDDSLKSWELEEIHGITRSVYTTRYPTNAKPNARETFILPIHQIEALKQPGLYFAVIRQPGRFTDKAYRIIHFVITNLGLQARVYPKKLEVFVHALDSAKPLRGIKMVINDNQTELEAITDEYGRASFAKRPEKDFFITATSPDNQFAFLDLRLPPLDLSSFPIQGLPEEALDPYIYASHALYRPGDTVSLNILLRDQDGLVATSPLNLSIVRPDNKVVWEEILTATTPNLGYYLQRFSLAEDAPAGTWRAELRLGDETKAIEIFEFKVQNYQAERMSLVLSGAKPLLIRDNQQIVSIQGSHLHGKPTAKQAVVATRYLQLERQPLGEAFKDYVFGVPEDAKRLDSLSLPEANLDEQGNGFLEFPPIAATIQSPLKTTIKASILELGGQPVASELQQTYWPAQHLVGIKPLFANATVAANSEAHFEIARVDPAANLLAAQHLTATLFSESYDYYWEYEQDKGWQQRGIRNQYPVLQQMLELPAGQQGRLALPVSAGQYRLELEDADTKLKTAYVFNAGWQAVGDSIGQPNHLELKLDKAVYKAGETAQLTVNLPAKTEALVTVEGGQLLWSKQLSLDEGSSVVELPIDKAWQRHDLYVAVHTLQPTDPNQQAKPERRLGILPILLDRSERKLELSLETPEVILAEQALKVVVKAANLKSQETLVTLSAVDTRVLSSAPTANLDPFSFYFSSHAYDADLYDSYNQIITPTELTAFVPTANTPVIATPPVLLPKLDRQLTALISEPVRFDAEGKAELTLNLPAFTGNLRLSAIAIGVEQLGSFSKDIQVTAPVQLKAEAPAFLAAGDQGYLKLEIKNTGDHDQLTQLKITGNDLVEGVNLERELSLNKDQLESIQLPLTTRSSLGLGQIQVELVGKDINFKRHLAIPIRPAYAATVSYQQQTLLGLGQSFEVNSQLSTDYLPNTAETCLSIANSPSLPVAGILRGLLNYPYHSLEQTVSSTYPYLFLDEAAVQQWDLPALSLAQRTQHVQEALIYLRSLQLSNGGFTLWAKSGREQYWLNAYVTNFLLDARAQGFVVPIRMLETAVANLQQSWKQETPQLEERYPMAANAVQMDLAVRAYTAYVLARENKLTLNDLKVFADKTASQMELGLSLVNLGLALTLQGDVTRGDELIQRGLNLPRKADSYLGDYGSVLRDQLMQLYHLLLAQQTVPNLNVQLESMLRQIQENPYLSTQEQAFIFLLGQLLEKQAKVTWQAHLVLDGQSIDLARTGSFNRCVNEFKPETKLSTKNDEPLYLSWLTQAHPKQMPAATDQPIRIERQWYNLEGKALNAADLKLGDLVLTRLNIEANEPIPHALVVDLLPSGFELESGDLQANEVLQALKLEDMAVSVTETMAYSAAVQEAFWPDRYLVNLALKAKVSRTVFYLVRIVQATQASVPQAYVLDLDRPSIQGLSADSGSLQTAR